MTKIEKFTKLARTFCVDNERNATRLWNWADHQKSPEPFWATLRSVCPQSFYGPSASCFHFTY